MTRCLSVSHTSHWITRNTLLPPNLALKKWADAFSLVDSGPPTQTFSHAQKNTPTRDLFFKPWWPFPLLPSLISLDGVFVPWRLVPCRNMRREKKSRNMRKIKETKRRKSDFPAMIFFLKNKWNNDFFRKKCKW